jgi:catechol-2,3-dioxygenase
MTTTKSMQVRQSTTPTAAAMPDRVVPFKMAHLVYRCARRDEMVAWYTTVFQAHTVFQDNVLTFLAYDDEHHRFAFFNMQGIPPKLTEATGVHHIAYSYRTITELLTTYTRLKEGGILPFWCINHGPTTSLYYRDPEANEIELQVDNDENAAAFFHSDAFARNPIGVEFDPDELVRMWQAGASDAELCAVGTAAIAPAAQQ